MRRLGLLLPLLLILSCQINKTEDSRILADSIKQQNGNCLIVNESEVFQFDFFPFDFRNYNTNRLLKYFKSNVTVDSIETNFDGYITRVYTFTDKKSKISFFVKINNTNGDDYFFIDKSSIFSDLIESKNGIKINMSRGDFSKVVKINSASCDTFTIQEGDMAIYYYFIFSKDRLKEIEIIPTE